MEKNALHMHIWVQILASWLCSIMGYVGGHAQRNSKYTNDSCLNEG